MNKQIWVISEFYYPDENATGRLITQIAEDLAKIADVSVVCGRRMGDRKKKNDFHFVCNGVVGQRLHSTTLNKDNVFFRLINVITLSVLVLAKLIKDLHREEIVLVVTNPPTLPLVVAIACKIKKAKYSVLIHDVYPEVLIATNQLSENNPLTWMMRWINRRVMIQASFVIVLGRDMHTLLNKNYNVVSSKIVIIPNWGEVNKIVPQERVRNSILTELSMDQKFIIQYVGNIGRTHNIELLLECAELLKDEEDLRFMIIGGGAKKKWLDETLKNKNYNNVLTHPFYPRERQSDVHTACDISVISFIPGMTGISVPSRMYNIMAAGKPILAITDEESELAMVVREENIGWVVTSFQAHDVVRTIMQAKENAALLIEMGKRARKAAEEKYSFEKLSALYRNIFMKELNA
jgi:colanic acid biosynthesis glycosyl transferase WcaI